ncbi:MAG: glycyl radical protein [Desulfobacteraceae bacterium]|nr:glycyl radical protein [Desulfobacteraceae bacterium]
MNQRVNTLRQQSLDTTVTLSGERARLVTDFYRSGAAMTHPVPIQRALCLKHILDNKTLCINDHELIVGERGPRPKAVPTYPEICLHTLGDLEILDTREKIPYRVSHETKRLYKETVIPFWQGKTVREKIFAAMDPAWIDAFEAGVFTEFQEQRSPGHTAGGTTIFRKGFLDLKAEIGEAINALDFYTDPRALAGKDQLTAMEIAADALIDFAGRHAKALDDLARTETDPDRQKELTQTAAVCRRVPAHAPETFHEALQYYWFLHVGIITELNPWDAFNPGRLDQHLYPFYQREINNGTLTRERAMELLSCFWVKFNNHPAPPKVGVTAKESNTYVDFCLINLGGVTRDNRDGVNELTYVILEVIETMRLLQPSAMVQVSRKNPDRFIRRALKIIETGFGQPSVFNTDAIVQELVLQGKSAGDAREGGASGCVEAGAFGREAYVLTGYFNLPKILEITLNNGVDPVTGRAIGIPTGDPENFETMEDLLTAYDAQVRHFIDIKIRGNNVIEAINAATMPVPLLSLVTEDCIQTGRDYNQGGARYNTSYIQGVGLGTATDALTAIRHNVFDENRVSITDLLAALGANFKGHEELLTQVKSNTPKYGNDDDRADDLLKRVFSIFHGAVDNRPNTRGGRHRINLLPTTCHVYFGSVTGALPDGRRAGKPFSEGISPVQGADMNGPTAALRSAAKIDHLLTGGTLLNQKFMPGLFKSDKARQAMVHLIRSYFAMDGHHVQFNVVDLDTLEHARQHPEEHRDLIVRVAGYSDYFVDLTPELQEEIMARTAHETF